MLDEAIDLYHQLLETDSGLARESQQALDEGLLSEDLYFGDRPLCSVLRPHMITAPQYAHVREACHLVISALLKLGNAALQDERLMEVLNFSATERRLVAAEPGYPTISALSRLDAFLADDGLHFIEYNAETPAGGAYTDVLTEVFLRLPVVQRFLERRSHKLLTFNTRESQTNKLLACYHQWGGRDVPHIAIVDWDGVPTATEFQLYQRYFTARGLPSVIVDPRALDYRNGGLYHGDTRIDLVYKRVLVHELLQHEDEVRALLQAYEDGAICMVNSPRAKLFHKKAIFALLTDERYQAGLSTAERDAVTRYVPWTRRVYDGPTTFHGQKVDLLQLVRERREEFILKPNDDYGGKGVQVGWEGSTGDWDRALRNAVRDDFVVQQRVSVARATFPSLEDGALVFRELSVDMDPFIVDGEANGFLTRIAGTTLLNVTAGGGSTVPTFVLEG